VTLSADISAFNAAMRRMGVTAAEGGARMATAMTRSFGAGYRDPDETTAEDVRRRIADRAEIRAIARTELRAARHHFDQHVDGLYADLSLPRDPHLIRGDQ